MLEQFSATIDKVYAAAADPSLWGEALRAVENYTGSTGAVLNLVPKSSAAMPVCLAGSFSEDDCAEYALNYMWRCPRIAFGEQHPDIPIHYDRMILTESEMDRDPTYEWFGKHGLRYYVAGWIGGSSAHRAYMSLQRSRRQGHVEPEQVEQFALISRHMAQALSLAVKLGTLEQQSRFSLAAINALPNAVFALDTAGNVMMTNSRADRLLSAGDGLVVLNGRLQCRLGSQQPQFDRLVKGALASDPSRPRGGWVRIQRAAGRRPYVALVARIDSAQDLFTSCQVKALLFVADPGNAPVPDEQALNELFGLTLTEARLAIALSGGHSIESAAVLLQIKPGTARTHLKSVFRKMSISRQQDLVRFLTSLSSVPPPAP